MDPIATQVRLKHRGSVPSWRTRESQESPRDLYFNGQVSDACSDQPETGSVGPGTSGIVWQQVDADQGGADCRLSAWTGHPAKDATMGIPPLTKRKTSSDVPATVVPVDVLSATFPSPNVPALRPTALAPENSIPAKHP